MKKSVLGILFCIVILITITGCRNEKELVVGEKSNIKIEEKDFSLSLKKDSLNKTGAILILKNNAKIDAQYDASYKIEKKQNNEWHKIDAQLYFNMMAYDLKPNEEKEIEVNWEKNYGKLSLGDYRIIKTIDIENEDGTFTSFNIAAEFTIK